jgi:metal-responsive CopG/Arc/MetJ family transcriptional regulator
MKLTKGKVSISLDSSILQDIELYSKSRNVSRSQVIESVLKKWQLDLKKKQMIEGYKAMAQENTRIAEEFSSSGQEVWPHE